MEELDEKNNEVCSIEAEQVKQLLPVEEEIQDVSEFFRVFGDPTRIKILTLLLERPLCVHVISEALSMQQTAISHQLKILRQSRLVRYKKDGRHVYYSLCDNHISELINTGLEHIREQ